MRFEEGDGAPRLLVQVVEQGDVAAEQVLVLVELDDDRLDLRRHVLEAADEALQAPLGARDEALDDAGVLQVARVEPARLVDDVEQKLSGPAHLLVAGLREHAVGERGHVTLRLVAEARDHGTVGEVDLRRDLGNEAGIGRNGRKVCAVCCRVGHDFPRLLANHASTEAS